MKDIIISVATLG
ncbi:MAG: hypothetical protein GW803_05715, partial [Caldiserica bacterium]|nr:hypothetical protein [Caldisericota bacterium]